MPLQVRTHQVKKTQAAMVDAFSEINTNLQIIASNLYALHKLIVARTTQVEERTHRMYEAQQTQLMKLEKQAADHTEAIKDNNAKYEQSDVQMRSEVSKLSDRIRNIGYDGSVMGPVRDWLMKSSEFLAHFESSLARSDRR